MLVQWWLRLQTKCKGLSNKKEVNTNSGEAMGWSSGSFPLLLKSVLSDKIVSLDDEVQEEK